MVYNQMPNISTKHYYLMPTIQQPQIKSITYPTFLYLFPARFSAPSLTLNKMPSIFEWLFIQILLKFIDYQEGGNAFRRA